MRQFKSILLTAVAATLLFSACKKEKSSDPVPTPDPHEQELITTVRLVVTNGSGFNKTFNYKVDNGFNSATPATPVIDDVMLTANSTYNVDIQIWNEAETPAEDITEEVKEENKEHLFVIESNPTSGAGSISFSDGSKDEDGAPLNQAGKLVTGPAGSGSLKITLLHEPTNKNGTTPADAGGETDAQASFPVVLK